MTLAERLVTRVSAMLGGRSVGRRSLLTGAAVVGSALVTNPWQYATRPLSAYAAVCVRRGLVEGGPVGLLLWIGPLLHRLQRLLRIELDLYLRFGHL